MIGVHRMHPVSHRDKMPSHDKIVNLASTCLVCSDYHIPSTSDGTVCVCSVSHVCDELSHCVSSRGVIESLVNRVPKLGSDSVGANQISMESYTYSRVAHALTCVMMVCVDGVADPIQYGAQLIVVDMYP